MSKKKEENNNNELKNHIDEITKIADSMILNIDLAIKLICLIDFDTEDKYKSEYYYKLKKELEEK